MSKTYRRYDQDQMLLLPPCLRDWLPEGHMALFISDIVDELDISSIEGYYEEGTRGYPPYHPRMMLKVLIYAYCTGVRSSRKIARKIEEYVAYRFLAGGNMPKFRTVAEFRSRHLHEFKVLFVRVLQLCQQAGLVKLGHVALDGTRMQANASKHKAMSYGLMKQEEARLTREIEELLKEAERIDSAEDKRYGKGKRGDELPAELACWENRYGLRKQTVEPVFGQIKSCIGVRQFLVRGLAKVKAEWALVYLCHNIRKLYMSSLATG